MGQVAFTNVSKTTVLFQDAAWKLAMWMRTQAAEAKKEDTLLPSSDWELELPAGRQNKHVVHLLQTWVHKDNSLQLYHAISICG